MHANDNDQKILHVRIVVLNQTCSRFRFELQCFDVTHEAWNQGFSLLKYSLTRALPSQLIVGKDAPQSTMSKLERWLPGYSVSIISAVIGYGYYPSSTWTSA